MGRFSAWAPKLLQGLCTQFPWLNLLFLLSKVLKPVPTQLAVDTWVGSKGHFLRSLLGGQVAETGTPFPTQGSQAKLAEALSEPHQCPRVPGGVCSPWRPSSTLSFLSCPREGIWSALYLGQVTGPCLGSPPLSHTLRR